MGFNTNFMQVTSCYKVRLDLLIIQRVAMKTPLQDGLIIVLFTFFLFLFSLIYFCYKILKINFFGKIFSYKLENMIIKSLFLLILSVRFELYRKNKIIVNYFLFLKKNVNHCRLWKIYMGFIDLIISILMFYFRKRMKQS